MFKGAGFPPGSIVPAKKEYVMFISFFSPLRGKLKVLILIAIFG
jgi:hypothetical protein